MSKRFHIPLLLACAMVLSALGVVRAEEPKTPPPERGRGAMVERIKNNLAQLDLTPDQQSKADEILADAAQQLMKLREESKGDLEALRDKAGGVFQGVRQKLQDVLTPAQQKKFQELMPRPRPEGPPPEKKPEAPMPESKVEPKPDSKPDPKPAGMTMGDMMGDKSPTQKAPAPQPVAASSAAVANAADTQFAPGTPAADFRLKNLDGKTVSLSTLRSKPTVLVFGSFTSPTFRDKADAFDDLKKDFKNKANVLIVYTREAYPNLEWDVQRNIDEQIRVAPHTSIDERQKMARMTRDGLKVDTDILIDDMDDAVTAAYDAMPNGCVVIDGAGKILLRQKWADVHGVRAALDGAIRAR